MLYWLVISILVFIVLILFVLIIKLYLMVRHLNQSSARLSYVIREDAKKYFNDAADKIVKTNEQFRESYTKIVKDGTASALSNASVYMERSIKSAYRDAGDVIVKARQDAQGIISSARVEGDKYSDRILDQSADIIQWVMTKYIGQTFSYEKHQEIINKLLDDYLNERNV